MLKRHFYPVYSVCCERGDKRQNNQDRVLARAGKVGRYSAGLFLVADGCGGLTQGEKISQLLVESFSHIWEEILPEELSSRGKPAASLLHTASGWLEKINEAAYAFGRETNSRVGSTVTLLLIVDRDFFILNAGDSRVYLYRNGHCVQLTEDQSLVADMLRNGEISPEDAAHYPHKNALTMCVGGFERLQLHTQKGRLQKNDVFLLCSDGLYNALGHEQLLAYELREVMDTSAQELCHTILPGAASDNVSALLVQIHADWRNPTC